MTTTWLPLPFFPWLSCSSSLFHQVFKSLQFQDAITKVCIFKLQLPLPPLPAPPLVPPLISSLVHWLAAFSCILLSSASVAPPLVLLVTLQVQQPLKNVSTEKEPAKNDRNILQTCQHFPRQVVCPLMFHRLQSAKSTIHGPWDEAVLR